MCKLPQMLPLIFIGGVVCVVPVVLWPGVGFQVKIQAGEFTIITVLLLVRILY